jgi:hypothetical protein
MISQSRKVLVLLSKGYVINGWCREEFDHACRHNEKGLVIVLIHDPSVLKVMDKLKSSAKSRLNNNGILPYPSNQVLVDLEEHQTWNIQVSTADSQSDDNVSQQQHIDNGEL